MQGQWFANEALMVVLYLIFGEERNPKSWQILLIHVVVGKILSSLNWLQIAACCDLDFDHQKVAQKSLVLQMVVTVVDLLVVVDALVSC